MENVAIKRSRGSVLVFLGFHYIAIFWRGAGIAPYADAAGFPILSSLPRGNELRAGYFPPRTDWASYTFCIEPGYCATTASDVSRVKPSTVACATSILSKGSL